MIIDCTREMDQMGVTSPVENGLLPAPTTFFAKQMLPCCSQKTSVSSDWSELVKGAFTPDAIR